MQKRAQGKNAKIEETKIEEEEEEEDEFDEMDEFYRREIELVNDWEAEIESKILPRQYWRSERATLF